MILKKTIYQWIFFIVLPVVILVLFLINPFEKATYKNYFAFTIGTIFLTIYYYYYSFIKNKGTWTNPFSLTFFFQVFFSIMGILVFEFREKFWTNYPSDMEIVGFSVFLSPSMMLLGKLIASILIHKEKTNLVYIFNFKKLNQIIWIMVLIGNFACMLLYDFYRDIPLFSSDIDASRIEIRAFSSGRGTLFILQLLLVIAIPLIYLRFMNKKGKSWKDLFIFVVQFFLCFIPLLFYGGRFYFLTPIFLVIITHSVFIRPINLQQAFISGIIMLIIALIFVTYRIFGANLDMNLFERAVWADIFPEIRAFGYVAFLIQEPHLYPKIIVNFISSLFPSTVLGLFNINKQLLLFSIGDYVASIIGSSLPIRLGLLGEAFLAYGMNGIAIVYFFLGFYLSIVSKIMRNLPVGDSRQFIGIIIGVISALIIPYGTNMFLTLFFCIFFSIIVVKFSSNTKSIFRLG